MEIGKQRYCHFVAAFDDQNYGRCFLRMVVFLVDSHSSARILRLLGARQGDEFHVSFHSGKRDHFRVRHLPL